MSEAYCHRSANDAVWNAGIQDEGCEPESVGTAGAEHGGRRSKAHLLGQGPPEQEPGREECVRQAL